VQSTACLVTMFAPAERASAEELSAQIALVKNTPSLTRILNAMMDMVVLLNRHRQIVFCNTSVVKAFDLADPERFYGMRLGEAISCANSCKLPGGCGTDEHCSVCGAVDAIMAAVNGRERANECRILRSGGEAMDLLMKSTPLRLGGEGFVITAMRDISMKNRHSVMERIFHHDILNTACGIKLLAQQTTWSGRANRILANVEKGIARLIKEIHFQQDLAAAENGRLAISLSPAKSRDIVQELVEAWEPFAATQHCSIVTGDIADVTFSTDRRLITRVISNMLKNAVEASTAGDHVVITCRADDETVSFSVSNPAVISRSNQLQMFQRSFSTKGHGRGVGTYSMKLLTEKYLAGKISFTSAEPHGTVFTATLPLAGASSV
jgi:signal transduction histidine kinase